MPFHDSRLGPGTLKIGTSPGVEYGFQISNCVLTPAVDSEDGTPTLAVPAPPPQTKTSYSLDGSAIDDFTHPGGFQRYCFDNDGLETDFVFTPNTADAATIGGKLTVRAVPMGGDVATQNTNDFSFPITGKPTITGGVAMAASAGKGKG